MPFRCSADDAGALVMPAAPNAVRTEQRHRQQVVYFAALQSFLTYSLGWTRHDKGLLWWLEHDRPIEDRRFALLDATWFRDGNLTGYAAWFARRVSEHPEGAMEALEPWLARPDLAPMKLGEPWASRFREALTRDEWTGGYDPLHLWGGGHVGAPSRALASGSARLMGAQAASRSATFVADVVEGWYSQLAELGGRLPPLAGGASWKVDVFVKPIGFLGTFRRSRATGLWFSGRHRYHSVGN